MICVGGFIFNCGNLIEPCVCVHIVLCPQTGTFASRATQNFSTVERACRELGLADDAHGHGAITFSHFAGNAEQRKHIVQFLIALKQRLGDEITPSDLSAAAKDQSASSSSSSSSSSAPCNRNLFASPAPAAGAPRQELMLQPVGETPDMAMEEGMEACALRATTHIFVRFIRVY